MFLFCKTLTKNEIIEQVCKDGQYLSYCKQVCSIGDLYNDLFQYLCLYLLEMPESRLIDIHVSGGLRMYCARIIYINAKSESSQFNKQYTERVPVDYIDFIDEYEYEIDNRILNIENEIDAEILECSKKNVYPASVKLLQIYAECGSYQEVSNKTKIPYKTVQRHIKQAREKIIKKINDKNTFSNAD